MFIRYLGDFLGVPGGSFSSFTLILEWHTDDAEKYDDRRFFVVTNMESNMIYTFGVRVTMSEVVECLPTFDGVVIEFIEMQSKPPRGKVKKER